MQEFYAAPTTPPSPRAYLPLWRGPIEGYTVKAIHRILPRLIRHYEFDDIFNEAFCVYLLVRRKYVPPVDNPAWFMALYKRCLASRIADIASRVRRRSAEWPMDEVPDSALVEHHDGHLSLLLQQLPGELIEALLLIVTTPTELAEPVAARTFEFARARCEIWLR